MPTVLREAGFEVRIYTFDHRPPHVHVWKAGAVLKVDLATHEVIEIIGAISDRDVNSGAPGGQTRGTANASMDEDSWQRVRSRLRIVSDMPKHGRGKGTRRRCVRSRQCSI